MTGKRQRKKGSERERASKREREWKRKNRKEMEEKATQLPRKTE